MNTKQANSIPLSDILLELGHEPYQENSREIWYFSPFRDETTPSFHVHKHKNIWYDFGDSEDRGGTVVDFLLLYYGTYSVGTILKYLEEMGFVPSKPRKVEERVVSADLFENIKIKPLRNTALLKYLSTRGFSPQQINNLRHIIQEMHYTYQGKPYFAIAFHNDSGGFELRNTYYKGTYKIKDITRLNWRTATNTLAVFEGFIDYLSAVISGNVPAGLSTLVLTKNQIFPITEE